MDLDQREAQTGDGQRGQRSTAQIKAPGARGVAGLWHLDNRGDDDERPQRQVDQEDRTP